MYVALSKLFLLIAIIAIFYSLLKRDKKYELLVTNYNTIVIVLFIITIFTTLYKIGEVPAGIHVDEAGMAYDAWSIANHGVDRYLYNFPVYFINYGGGQNALYGYILALLLKFFDFSIVLLRIPAFIFRVTTFISLYFMTKNYKLKSLLLLFLFSILPIFVMSSRWGLESYLMMGMMSIAVCLGKFAIDTRRWYFYVLSGISFGLTLYTYAISYITVPLFLVFILLYAIRNMKINIKEFIMMLVPLIILGTPLLLVLLVNNGYIEEIRSFISIPKFLVYRGSEISFSDITENLNYIVNLMKNDSREVLFYNAIPIYFTMYFVSIPFVCFGFFKTAYDVVKSKFKNCDLDFILCAWFICSFLTMLLISSPNINKMNAIFIPFIYFISKSLLYLTRKIKYVIWVILTVYIFNFTCFYYYYMNTYNNDMNTNYLFANTYLEAFEDALELDVDTIYSSNITAENYIYPHLYCEIPPQKFSKDNVKCDKYNKEFVYTISDEMDYSAAYIVHNMWVKENIDIWSLNYKVHVKEYADKSLVWFEEK